MNARITESVTAVGSVFARVSIMMLLVLTLFISLGALHAADPAASAEVARILSITSIGPVDITLIDPFIYAVVAWSIAPIWPLFADLVDEIREVNE